jgi:type I restriction enzyme S subunit
MFGDPATNQKGWPISTLGQVVEEFRYGTSQKSGPVGLPVLRIPNVIGNQIDPKEMKLVSVPVAEVDRLRLLKGDFLFVRTNGNPDYVGRSAVFDEDVMQQAGFDGSNTVYASYLIRARLQRNIIEPYFLQGYLSSAVGRRQLKERCKTSAGQFNINTAGLAAIPIFLPPMAAQSSFVRRTCDVFDIQSQQSSATAKAQVTFEALLARCFAPTTALGGRSSD